MQPPTNETLTQRDKASYLQTFRRYPLALAKGRGARVWDVEGNEYLDVLAGIAVNSLGHCHPKVVKAIQAQAETLIHISNFYTSEPQVKLAEKLQKISAMDRVFFANSGTESVEGAIKLARKYAMKAGRGNEVIAMENSFHGRTYGALATAKSQMQAGFGPMVPGFYRVPFNNLDALKAKISTQTAAIILEPIQGEGGIRPADADYLHAVAELCSRENIVLICDEIQCGVGRTGEWFGYQHYGIKPDIVTSAKALGNGIPIGAILAAEHVAQAIDFGDHGTTYGGNPLVTATALATIEAIEEEDLLQQARENGDWVRAQFAAKRDEYPITDIRGLGLMIGIEFTFETKPLVAKLLEHRVLANATAGNVLRMVPPLNITREELQTVLDRTFQAIDEIYQPTHA